MAFLLDTNVLSELRKAARCDAKVRAWARRVSSSQLWISVLSLGEIRKGIESLRRKDPPQCAVLERWLGMIELEFEDHILPVTEAVADEWGRMQARQPLGIVDSLIAATAQVHHLSVVTRNAKDFKAAGVPVVNPFL
jgi:hypothetical protein